MKVSINVQVKKPDTTPPANAGVPVDTLPNGFIFDYSMAEKCEIGVVFQDASMDDRGTNLGETNAVHPLRPIYTGVVGFIMNLFGVQVSSNGKIILNIGTSGIYSWMLWIVDLIGERNAGKFVEPEDGFCDTDEDGTTPTSPEIKIMAAKTGGSFLLIEDSIFQNGWFDVIRCFDYNTPPVKGADGIWRVNGIPYNELEYPHMFTNRVNRRNTRKNTWLTHLDDPDKMVVAVTDVPKGDEAWPTITNGPAAIERYKIGRYPPLGSKLMVYRNSLIEDGNLTEWSPGLAITLGAVMVYGSKTYVEDWETGLWYLAEEMLVTVVEPYAGKGFDYRCYVSRIGDDGIVSAEPWMGRLGHRAPRCGWQRSV
jgi:hypothetical protein